MAALMPMAILAIRLCAYRFGVPAGKGISGGLGMQVGW